MRLDHVGNPQFDESDILNMLYQGDTENIDQHLSGLFTVNTPQLASLEEIAEVKFIKDTLPEEVSIEDFDKISQELWFMPDEYFEFDVREYCLGLCKTAEEIERVEMEIAKFQEINMTRVLQWMKYFVDTCNKNNVTWGVGRGSSVASYVLYLLDVHCINSLKYNIPFNEFVK